MLPSEHSPHLQISLERFGGERHIAACGDLQQQSADDGDAQSELGLIRLYPEPRRDGGDRRTVRFLGTHHLGGGLT